jgi:acyl phosphate:glycerol-3-phosphate acyltransferase
LIIKNIVLNILYFVIAGTLGYLIGSVPWGLIIVKAANLGDIRKIGSHGTGATNVLRTGNKWLALLTMILDITKGILAVILVSLLPFNLGTIGELFAGLFAVLGHNYPIWIGFKGGKGVATACGVLLAISWPVAVLCFTTWLIIVIISKYSSLASLIATLSAPIYAYFFMTNSSMFMMIILVIIIFISHRANIIRLLRGEESKIKL